MKTIIKVTLMAVVTLLFFQPVNGQRLLNKLREKVEEKIEKKVEEKVEKKVDETIDNQLDKIEGSINKNEPAKPGDQSSSSTGDEQRQQRMQKMLKGIGISGDPVPIENSYSFNNLIQMHFESFNRNGKKKDEGDFITHFDPQSKSVAYQMVSGNMSTPVQGLFIVDLKNEAVIILSEEEGKKNGLVYGLGSFFSGNTGQIEDVDLTDTPESYLNNPNVKRTGRTKTIAGYKCEEYQYKDEESESLIWITKDLKLSARDFFGTLFKTSLYAGGIGWGYMMQITTTDNKTGEKSSMEVTRVDKNSNKKFSIGDYQMTNLGSLTIPQE